MKKKCLVISHRGSKGHMAENTIESIKKALSFHVDGIEIDVHVCKSGDLVVFHDFTLDRMTNGTGELSKYSLFELKKLRVETAFEIPTLTEVLDCIDRQCFLNIELKGKNTALEVSKIIKRYVKEKGWKYSDFIVSSFQHRELEAVFKTNKNIPLAVLTKASVEDAIAIAKTIHAKILHPNFSLLTRTNVQQAKAEGYKIYTWTVNKKRAIQRMKHYHVDGIISDFPDRI